MRYLVVRRKFELNVPGFAFAVLLAKVKLDVRCWGSLLYLSRKLPLGLSV